MEEKNKKIKFLVVIPARYASSRFPGKPLAMLGGQTVISRVYNQASLVSDNVIVATDDIRIFESVERGGGKAVMTRSDHKSGTDRVWEAYNNIKSDADVVINIQGDEPFIHPSQIQTLMQIFIDNPTTQIATLARQFDAELGFEALFDANLVKLTFDDNGNAIYFSRAIIPYIRNYNYKEWLKVHKFYTHIGVYAYRKQVLEEITSLPQTSLEKAESLEQLRWLQNGYVIKTGITKYATIGIDTPQDLLAAEKYLKESL